MCGRGGKEPTGWHRVCEVSLRVGTQQHHRPEFLTHGRMVHGSLATRYQSMQPELCPDSCHPIEGVLNADGKKTRGVETYSRGSFCGRRWECSLDSPACSRSDTYATALLSAKRDAAGG